MTMTISKKRRPKQPPCERIDEDEIQKAAINFIKPCNPFS
jgi:hypothetical protein